jgi:hypothetical protein
MTFYVEKRLALGSINFGASAPESETPIDGDPALNTGPTGEFVGRRGEGFFFGGHDRFESPSLPTTQSISSSPFWSSLKPDGTPRSYGFLALMAIGTVLLLLGLAVVTRKGPQGWFEVVIGLAMIATPITLTAQTRRKIREQEERERGEREALEKRNRELLAAYTAALKRASEERSEEVFAQLERERQALTLPYQIWGPAARRTVLLVGFDELSKRGAAGATAIAQMMDRLAAAAGLTSEDQAATKLDLYRTVLWHLLADDRLGETQEQQLVLLKNGLSVDDQSKVVEEFRRVRGLSAQKPSRVRCSIPLTFNEHCIYQTPTDQGMLHVTNKRVILEGKRHFEMPVGQLFDVTVSADESLVTVKTDKKPLRLRIEEPIYAAAILDRASQIDERPRGFA